MSSGLYVPGPGTSDADSGVRERIRMDDGDYL